jgi:hypothetical protein
MNHLQVVLFSSSILLPAIIAGIKFRNTERSFYPFIFFIWIGVLNEIISYVISMRGSSTTFNNNLYILAEALLILWQFKEWDFFQNFKNGFIILFIALIIVWFFDHSNKEHFSSINLNFRLFYSLMIVLMSIHINNRLIFTFSGNLLKSPVFLVCNAFTIYFTYKILVEVFWIYGLNTTKSFRIDVYIILTWINALTNILYSIAMVCIPKKPRYIELS